MRAAWACLSAFSRVAKAGTPPWTMMLLAPPVDEWGFQALAEVPSSSAYTYIPLHQIPQIQILVITDEMQTITRYVTLRPV